MRYWPTLLMAGVLAALAGYLYLVEFPSRQRAEDTRTQAVKLLPFEESDITGLSLKTEAGQISMVRDPRGWNLTVPLQAEADSREVQSMVRALVTGKVTRVVEDKAMTLSPFGLQNPITVVTVSAADKQETFSIGDSGPLSSTLYVLRGSDNKVLLTDLAPKDFINKSLMTFRRKDLLRFAQSDVERIRLTYPSREIVLYQVQGKPKPKWTIRYPIEAEADQSEVRSLLFRLEDLKAMGIIDFGPEREALGKRLVTPLVKVTLHTAQGDQTVKLYQPDPASGEAYAETKPDAPLYRITPTAIKELTKELFALQDKRLLGVDYTDIAMLAVKTREEQYVLINQTGEWVLEDQPTERLQQETVDLFVSRVANLPAEERVIKQSAPLAPYGLLSPAAEFIATGRDGKVAGKLVLGNQVGGLVYATGQRLQGIFQARADILGQIPLKKDLLAKSSEKGTSTR